MPAEEKDDIEYIAQVSSPAIAGEARLSVGEDALSVTSLFDAEEIPYARIRSLAEEDYGVTVVSDAGVHRFSRMGNGCEPFYGALYGAYNRKVRKALFVSGAPLLKTRGEYRFEEHGLSARGAAPIELYEDCVLLLPPDDNARRIPLCFVTALEQGDFTLTLRLDTRESYTLAKLGYDTAPFLNALEGCLRRLREKALAVVKSLDPSLAPAQASAVARLMPVGSAAPMGALHAIAPSFVAALEAALLQSRSAEEFAVLKAAADPAGIHAGIIKRFEWGAAPDADTQEETMLWLVAPGKNGTTAAVEFAVDEGEAAATFLYRFEGGFPAFVGAFNRALEAISFRREAIRLSEEELQKPAYANAAMAVRRNASLRLVRAAFAGRAIHASPERWKEQVLDHLR